MWTKYYAQEGLWRQYDPSICSPNSTAPRDKDFHRLYFCPNSSKPLIKGGDTAPGQQKLVKCFGTALFWVLRSAYSYFSGDVSGGNIHYSLSNSLEESSKQLLRDGSLKYRMFKYLFGKLDGSIHIDTYRYIPIENALLNNFPPCPSNGLGYR